MEKGTKGYDAVDIEGKLSLRASVTSSLSFDDVRLPAESMLPGAEGLAGPLACLNQARYGIAWGAVGGGDVLLRYGAWVRDRSGAVWQAHRHLPARTGEAGVDAHRDHQSAALGLSMGRLKDADKLHHTQVSMAKQNNVMWALKIARMAREVLGANGISTTIR